MSQAKSLYNWSILIRTFEIEFYNVAGKFSLLFILTIAFTDLAMVKFASAILERRNLYNCLLILVI